jgi:hypothetical protein|nr:MAG TPA: chromosome segregation ATPase [Caudoviricetes sp.]
MQFKELGSLFSSFDEMSKTRFKGVVNFDSMQNWQKDSFNSLFKIDSSGVSAYTSEQIKAKASVVGLNESLTTQALSMANDASLTEKAATGKLTWGNALKDGTISTQELVEALRNSNSVSDEAKEGLERLRKTAGTSEKDFQKLTESIVNGENGLENISDKVIDVSSNMQKSTGIFDSTKNALNGMLISLKAMLPVIAAVGAAIAVYKAWDYTQTGFTRAQEKFENALSSYKNTKSEIESLNSELDNTKSRIEELKELQDNGVITFAEEVELEKLQHTNDELERQLEIKTKLAEAQSKIVAENAKAASSEEQSYTENQREKYGIFLGTLKSIGDTIFAPTKQYTDSNGNVTFNTEKGNWKQENNNDTTITSQFTSNIKKLSDAKKELSETEKKLAKNPQDKLQLKNQKEQLKNIEEITSALSNQYNTIQSWVESSTDEYGNALKGSESYVKQWKDAINEYVNMGKTKNEKYLNNLENYFSSSKSGSSMKDYLVSLAKDGKSAEEALEAFRASGMRLKDIGVSENAFVRYFEDIKREAQEADEAVKSVDGTFDGLKKSFESENQGANYDATMGYYKTAKEMYKNGLVGTDDFKSMAQFGVGYDIAKKLKDNADAYTYASDAYVEAWEQSQALLERWYGNEDELTNMTNVLNDFKDAGLASSLGDNEWTFKNDDGSMKFKTTAEAADKLNTSVSNVELAMSKLEEHGFEFDGIEKSGELLENYKNSLDQIKDVYNSMEDGAQKDRLKKLIEGYDSEYEKFQDDLSGLSEDQIVNIKFEYDLASIQQKIQELKSMAEASGSNQDQAALRVAQEQALGMLEGKTGVTKDSDEGYAQSYAKRTSLTKDMAGKSEEERAAINQEINALLELQNAFQQFKLDGGELDWNSFLDTPTATALFNDLVEKGTLTEKQIKELFGDSITCNIDAELNDDDLQKKLTSLKTDEKITFKADVDNLDDTQVEAIKNQDGTIKYTANIAGVPKEVHKITEQDGTIHFTTEFDGSLDWINNNLQNGETITYKADVSGIQKDIEACKDENGTIHYYSVMDDGSKQELTQQTDKDGKITYVADTSEVENAVKNTESKNPKVKVELTPDEQRVQDALKSLLNDQTKTTFFIDADFSKVKDDINALEVGHSIVFTANVDGVDQAVAAVKYQDGSIGYIANVDGVYYQLSAVQNTDGTVSYTIGNYPTEVPNANQTIDRTPNNSQVSKSPSSVGQTVNRTPNNSGILHAPTIVQKVIRFFTGGDKLIGTAHASGTLSDSSNLKDSWKTKKDEVALTGEVGEELVVSGNRWFTTGSNGAEFANIPAGSVVFNSKQTKELLSQGFTKSRGKGNPSLPGLPAFLEGTAYASGGRLPSSSSSSSSSSKKKSSSSSSTSSSRNSGSSPSSSSSSNSSSSSADNASEKVIDWIETLLSRVKRITDLAVNSIDRAIGLVNKQVKAADAISKVQAEIGANQEAAQAYLNKANSIDLSDVYKRKIMEGELTVESVNDETLQKNIEDYKSYYESYLSAMDNVLELEDKLTELAEKRLSIIEDQYDAIGDLKEAIKSGQEENRTLLENLGTSINSDANKNSIKQSITTQSQLYSSLTKKLEAYEAEVASQLKSGLMKKGSEQWYNAQKNIQEFATNITKASNELIELQDKLRQIQYDVLQNSIDSYARQTNKMNAYIDLLGAQDRQVPENLYQQQIKLNNNQIAKQYNLRAKYKKEQEKYDVNSKRYQELAEKINDADIEILNLRKDNEELKDSIFELRFTNIDKAIQKYSDLEDELSNFRDLLNDDAFVDKQGGITDEGLANIALLSQSIGNAKQKIADYTTGLTKLYEAYKNGTISADEYNEKAQEYRKGIQETTKDVKSYQNSLTDLYMKAMQTEVDYLGKIIKKRQEALSRKKEYYEYDKKIKSQNKDINSIKAQYEAIKNSNNLADKAKAKQLAAQIKEKEEELADTKRDHAQDMQEQGYTQMSEDLSNLLEDTEYEISHNADKQLEIITSMLDKEVASYEAAYAKINSIIRETGFNGSSDFRNEQKELSSQQGAQNQKNEATQSQSSANKKPSSAASGTKTDKINEGKRQNDKITQEILKPEETKRKVAELTVDKTSVTLEEGKSIGIKTSVRPNDAANKTLKWTSSNSSVATASNGTIKAIKAGSCTITVATTDGGGISKTIGVTVTKKPEPAKPVSKPTASNGKDGILRVGDTATLSGRYYYDSWGQRPAGSRYAGVQDGVTVDSYTSSEYGGNGKSTGDYKVHIGGTDGVYKDLGWVRPDQLSGYKDGIERVPYDQVAEINEGDKDETIITPKGHTLTLLTRNSSVLKNEAQRTLWDIANNPQLFAKNLIAENLVNSMPQGFSGFVNDVKLPDVTTNNRSIVFNLNDLVNIEQMTNTDLPDLQTIIEKSYDNMVKRTTQEARKLGIKRTR